MMRLEQKYEELLMSDLFMKIKVTHEPAESPGSWLSSKLSCYIKGDRQTVKQIETAIIEALRGGEDP